MIHVPFQASRNSIKIDQLRFKKKDLTICLLTIGEFILSGLGFDIGMAWDVEL